MPWVTSQASSCVHWNRVRWRNAWPSSRLHSALCRTDNPSTPEKRDQAMTTRTQLRRVERAEQAAKTQLRFSPECLCFPDDERPEFRWQVEAEIAARVLCPLHGLRFKVVLTRFLYRAARFYSSDMQAGCPNRSEVYQRAMRVSFDTNLWPANEEDAPGADALLGCVLVLRDGGGKRFIAPKGRAQIGRAHV